MFLRRNDDFIVISNFDDLNLRLISIIEQLIDGEVKNNQIITLFVKLNFLNLIDFLNDKNLKYVLDQSLQRILDEIEEKKFEFSVHSKNALEIKNRLNDSDKGFVDFLVFAESNIKRRLYEHQAKAAYHMAYSLNSCNFSVPGTGKTTIVYSAYSFLKSKSKVDRLLIIGPLSSYYPWLYEYYECFKLNPDIVNLSELDLNEKKKYLLKHSNGLNEINFVNYEGLSNIIYELEYFLNNGKTMVVLDEAHKIKNPTSQRSINTLKFASKASSRIILTGTPIPNGYQDLYSLFEFVWPNREITGFRLNELKKLTQNPNQQDVNLLMDNIDPFYIRIRKEHLKLPAPIHNEPIKVGMGQLQKEIYNSLISDFVKSDYSTGDEQLIFELKKAKLIRLMQASTNPSTIDLKGKLDYFNSNSVLFEKIKNYKQIEVPEKFKVTLDLVKYIQGNHENKKIIIWSIFVKNIYSLKAFLEKNGMQCEVLMGEVDNNSRAEIIRRFHEDEKLQIIIANPAAVSESISLHKACHNAIYFDKNFNAAQFIQSKDRIHRVGLNKNDKINYYYLLSENSIDELVHRRLLEKEKMMLEIIEGSLVPLFDEGFSSDLSINDIHVIEDYFKREFN